MLTPLVLTVTRHLGLPAVPYLIALATAANVGSVATLTGNPQNMLVGSFSRITYRGFLLRLAPVAMLGLVAVFLVEWRSIGEACRRASGPHRRQIATRSIARTARQRGPAGPS